MRMKSSGKLSFMCFIEFCWETPTKIKEEKGDFKNPELAEVLTITGKKYFYGGAMGYTLSRNHNNINEYNNYN